MEKRILELKQGSSDEYEYAEAIKTLRTNLQFCGKGIQVILFTSAVPEEGKSEITYSTAESLADIGKRVLLIDTDIRKSMLTMRYEIKKKVDGLSQFLSGQKNLEEVMYGTSVPGLDVIFAGPYSPNPTELLEEKEFGELIKKLRDEYDYILIDTPPMGLLIDGAIVACHCDGAVLVVESGAISRRLEQKVLEQFRLAECRVLGAVLNKVDIRENGYYGRYGRYNRYGKYEKYGRYKNEGSTESSYNRLEAETQAEDEERTEA